MATFAKNLKRINNTLNGFETYQPAIPMTTIMQACEEDGMVVLQEDGTRWSGFICGAEGETIFPLGDLAEVNQDGTLVTDGQEPHIFKETKHALRLSWYKMQSGRYEIVMYVS